LIPLYAIGVFTSFTLSQAGMARRHLRIKEPRWRVGLAINGVGAATTAVVTVVIAITKFLHGAWAVMVFVPLMVWLLVRLNRQYEQEHRELDKELPVFDASIAHRPIALLLVEDLGRETVHALQYVKTIRAEQRLAVYFARNPRSARDIQAGWDELGIDVPSKVERLDGDLATSLAGYVASLPGESDVNVIIPGSASMGFVERLRSSRRGAHLAKALLPLERARITVVRDHLGPGHPITETIGGRRRLRVLPRPSHRAVVLVDKLDRASLRAVRYALSLAPTEVRAVHAALDQENQELLMRRWMELGVPVELDVIECWDRNVARSLERYVVELMGKYSEVTVVMPRRDDARLSHRLLHDRTSRKIARALGRYEHVDLAVVPYYFGKQHTRGADGRLT
jgi:hypothetical protein